MNTPTKKSLYEALLGDRGSVQEVLDAASKEIGEIFTKPRTNHRVRRSNGVAFVRLYDFNTRNECHPCRGDPGSYPHEKEINTPHSEAESNPGPLLTQQTVKFE